MNSETVKYSDILERHYWHSNSHSSHLRAIVSSSLTSQADSILLDGLGCSVACFLATTTTEMVLI